MPTRSRHARLLYHCRLCGQVFAGRATLHGPDLMAGLSRDQARPDTPARVPHWCDGGHEGIGDLVGLQYDDVVPSKEQFER